MPLLKVFMMIIVLIVLSACTEGKYVPIDPHQSFIASVNILEPSIGFYNSSGEKIATWAFDKAYTGATLIEHDKILLYGHQLSEADMYEISSGKIITTIESGLGTTNAFYNNEYKLLFLTNSETNTVTSFSQHGKKLNETMLGNYPMSMASHGDNIYIINYKDTALSVLNMETLQVVDNWDIDKSSNGIIIVPEQNEIWVGGHGEGSHPNETVDMLSLKSGKKIRELNTSFMPTGFSRSKDEIYIINHGANELSSSNTLGELMWSIEVGANPFAIAYYRGQIVVGGFDDHKLYFIQDGEIIKSIKTDKGPFQLLVREVQ